VVVASTTTGNAAATTINSTGRAHDNCTIDERYLPKRAGVT
jgi:hypothetical protein